MKGIRLFSLFGFEVKLHPSWFILAVLLTWSLALSYFPALVGGFTVSAYWLMGALGATGLFLSIVLHECGHSVVARRQGIPMKGITLFIFGGVAEMEDEPPTAKSEFWMAIAGPVVSVFLAACFFLLSLVARGTTGSSGAYAVFHYLTIINLVLVAFNLLPAFPLDGGRVLRSYLWNRHGDLRKATRTTAAIGSGFGAALIGLGVVSILFGNFIGGMWWFLIGLFLRGAAQTSSRQVEIRHALEGEPVRRFMKTDPITVPPQLSLEELVQDYLYRHHYRFYPVVDDSHVLGCVGVDDVRTIPRQEWSRHSVREVMHDCGADNMVPPDADATKVLGLMNRTGNSHLLVGKDKLEGIVSLQDMLRFLSMKIDLEADGHLPARRQDPFPGESLPEEHLHEASSR